MQEHCWSNFGPGPDPIQPTLDAGSGDLTTLPEVGPVLRMLGETCDARNPGTAQRSDNCAPGLVCIDGNTQSLCFKICTNNSECGGS